MKVVVSRLVRFVVFGGGAFGLYLLLEPWGVGWLVLPIAALAILLWYAVGSVRRRWAVLSEANEDRWSAALLDPDGRPAAIAEVRAARAKLADKPKRRSEHARLGILLAELLDVAGDREAALQTLGRLDHARLTIEDRALVSHAEAVIHLRAGDMDAAKTALSRLPTFNDKDMDLRRDLLQGAVAVETGGADRGLELANRVRRLAGTDEALVIEARVLRAAALDGGGAREEALEILSSLDRDVLEMLLILGQPRVKRLAGDALKE